MSEMDRDTVVGRLLGPGRPELSCDGCFEELDRYVEPKLAGSDPDAAATGLRAHLEGCPACAEDHDSLLAYLRSQHAG